VSCCLACPGGRPEARLPEGGGGAAGSIAIRSVDAALRQGPALGDRGRASAGRAVRRGDGAAVVDRRAAGPVLSGFREPPVSAHRPRAGTAGSDAVSGAGRG
jgi:hypothetical protein